MGELFAQSIERVVKPVEGIHNAIANRWLGLAGQAGKPVAIGYLTLTKTIYSSVRVAASALGSVVPVAVSAQNRHRAPRMRRGLTSIANALWGHDLERHDSRLALPMTFRESSGRPIDLTPSAVAGAFPDAGRDLVVLVHGLGETEHCWRRDTNDLAVALRAAGRTPVLVRYNTGRHISTNGEELSELIERLTDAWPMEVESIALVGNSMGGLVVRSAVDAGIAAGVQWPRTTRHLITIGTPHLGTPLEKGANYVAWGLSGTAESRPLADFLRGRSDGIKDLRFGATQRQEWADIDPDALFGDAAQQTAPTDGIDRHFIAGVVTDEVTHPVGAAVGDMVVRVGSALGLGRRRRVDATDSLVVGRQRHSRLATDPTVHDQICNWLTA